MLLQKPPAAFRPCGSRISPRAFNCPMTFRFTSFKALDR